MSRRSYLGAAFNARPLGMPIPPNWFGLAAFALLGALVNPGFLLIGAGLELAYLWTLARSPRFRALVDGRADADAAAERLDARYAAVAEALPAVDRRRQEELEARCAEIVETLAARGDASLQAEGLAELAWLHLRLLAARVALARVVEGGARDADELGREEARVAARLAEGGLDPELRRSLEEQARVLGARRGRHAEAARRLERVEAELVRVHHQVALLREEAFLAADDGQVARSVDALTASLSEASRWLQEEDALLGGGPGVVGGAAPVELLRRRWASRAVRTGGKT